jgi:hypothetical protein
MKRMNRSTARHGVHEGLGDHGMVLQPNPSTTQRVGDALQPEVGADDQAETLNLPVQL